MAHLHPKHPTAPLSVRVGEDVIAQLEALAQATGRTKSFLASEAIDRYLETESWQVQAIKQTVTKANSSGAQFVDNDSVSDWLNTWGANEEKTPPK